MSELDPLCKQLLDKILLRYTQDNPMTVSDAMALSNIASPATIQRKLDLLRESGLIEQVFKGKNRRTKYLVTTVLSEKYFKDLSDAMAQAVAQPDLMSA
jgi:DNA-binding MarR family transcriptional regulator